MGGAPAARLTGRGGQQLELRVLGYEFPAEAHQEDDANWLVIEISASNDKGPWTASGPSLRTWDVETLAGWLEGISEGLRVDADLEFLEPDLGFELVQRDPMTQLRVWIELGLRPPWAGADVAGLRDLCIELRPTSEELHAASLSLRDQLQAFPPRAI